MPSTNVVASSNKGTYCDIKFILNELAAFVDMCSDFRIIKVYCNLRANFRSDNQGVKTVSGAHMPPILNIGKRGLRSF